MTTIHNLERLADAVEALAEDHKARVGRIESRRQHMAVKEAHILKLMGELAAAVAEHFTECAALEDAELAETNGEPEQRASLQRFETIMGGKPNGDGRHNG